MASIKRNKDVNLGGSVQLCYIPISSVDVANFPDRVPGTLTITTPIPLIPGAKWFEIETVRESIDNSDVGRLIVDGSLYDHTVGGFYANDNWEVTGQFDKMKAEGRYLVLRKDANDFWTLKGTPKEPLTFTFSKVSRDRVTGLKGYELKFTGQCTKPELYFYAPFDTDEGTIGDGAIPGTYETMQINVNGVLVDTVTFPIGGDVEIDVNV